MSSARKTPGTDRFGRTTSAGWLLALWSVATLVAAQAPVVIVDARVVWTEAILDDDGIVFGLEVEDVIHGFAPGGLLAARAPEGDAELGRYLEARPGSLVRVELRQRDDGLYDLVGAHDLPATAAAIDEPSAPPPLVAAPDPREDLPRRRQSSAAVPRRILSAAEDTSFEQDVVELVNQQRWSYDQHAPTGPDHLPPLKRVGELTSSTELHSFNMATRDFFAHCDLDTLKTPWIRMNDAGYYWNTAGENAASGQTSPAEVMSSWMASAGHRANVMGVNFREIGVGFYFQSGDQNNVRRDSNGDCLADAALYAGYGEYWTQNFGARPGIYPVVIEREASSTTSQTVALYVYGAGFAQRMRFSNDGSTYSSWEPYSTAKSWTLSAGGGDKTVWAQLDSDGDSGAEHTASDAIYYSASCPTTTIQNQPLDGSPSTYQNCAIVAGPNVPVTGDTSLLADTVALRSGFRVQNSVELRIGPRP